MKALSTQPSWCKFNWYRIALFSVFVVLTGILSAYIKGQVTVVPLTVNALPRSASIRTAGEQDIYSFTTGISGGTFTIQTYGNLNTYIYLYRLSGTTPIVIAEDNDSGLGYNAKITRTLSANMTYYIRTRANLSTAIGNYFINVVKEPYFQPPRNLAGTAGFRSITLNWTAPWSDPLPVSYSVFRSTTENGSYLQQSTVISTSATYAVTPGSTYWYYVKAVYATGTSVASNKVSVTALDATILTIGTSLNASLGSLTEEDWYKFYVSGTNPYSVAHNVMAGGTVGMIDMIMYLYESDMTTLIAKDENTNPYWGASLSHIFPVNKWYYVRVKASFLNSPGSYNISVMSNVGVYSVGLKVDANAFKSSIYRAGETDMYTFFTGTTAGTYTMQTYGSLNTKMTLYDGSPYNPILETDEDDGEGLNAKISRTLVANKTYSIYITAPATGEYSIDVKGPSTPVTGSTVGNTLVYSSTSTTINRRAQPVTMTESGTIKSIAIYHGAGTGNLILAVYNNANALPSQKIAETPVTPVTSSEGWQTVNLTTPVTVTQGSTIWLAWVFQNTVTTRYTSGTPGLAQSSATWSGGMPAVFGTSAVSGSKYSIYANYTPAANVLSTVGNTQVFSSVSTTMNRRAQPIIMTETGTIKSVAIYHGTGTGSLILAVYNNANALPNQKIAETPITPVSNSEGWQTVNLISPVTISQGSTIWLAWVFQNTVSTRYTSGTPGRAQSSEFWSGSMPATFGTSSTSGSKYSIYANYTAAGTKSTENDIIQIDEPLVQKDNFEFNVYPTLISTHLNIDLKLPEAQHAIIRVYDITGRKIADLWNGILDKGENRLYFDDLSIIKDNSGSKMLIIQLFIDNKVETRKILIDAN